MMRQQDKPIAAGLVRGPGTAVSDGVHGSLPHGSFVMPADSAQALGLRGPQQVPQVPVALSAGEHVMHPQQVHAFGLRALQGLKDATHTPVRQPASDGRRLFFANGGAVDEDERRRLAAIASTPNSVAGPRDAAASSTAQTAITSASPARVQSPVSDVTPAPRPAAQVVNEPQQTRASSGPQPGRINFDAATNTYSGTNVGRDAQFANSRGGTQPGGGVSSMEWARLSARPEARVMLPDAPAAPHVAHSGNDWGLRNELRNLRTAAESAYNSRRDYRKGPSPAEMAYQKALEADAAARGAVNALGQERTREGFGLARQQVQSSAQLQDNMARQTLAQRAQDFERQRYEDEDVDRKNRRRLDALGLQQKQQEDDLRQRVLMGDEPQRQRAAWQLAALGGRGLPSESQNLRNQYLVLDGEETTDALGLKSRGPQRLIDLRGDAPRQVNWDAPAPAPQAGPTPTIGQVIDGHKYIGGNPNDRRNWRPV